MDFAIGENTIQDFIDHILKSIENNEVRSKLIEFVKKTQELEIFYHMNENSSSPRFSIILGNNDKGEPLIFQYFIKKDKLQGHYCLYISIPRGHPFHGKIYYAIPDAIYSQPDEDDSSRWVFGWKYSHYNILTTNAIFLFHNSCPQTLLEMQIISYDIIEADVNRYSAFLVASNPIHPIAE